MVMSIAAIGSEDAGMVKGIRVGLTAPATKDSSPSISAMEKECKTSSAVIDTRESMRMIRSTEKAFTFSNLEKGGGVSITRAITSAGSKRARMRTRTKMRTRTTD